MIKDIYISRVDGHWSGYLPSQDRVVLAVSNNLIDFYYQLKEHFPDYRMRCVRNDGVDEKIRVKRKLMEKLNGRER